MVTNSSAIAFGFLYNNNISVWDDASIVDDDNTGVCIERDNGNSSSLPQKIENPHHIH